MELRRILVGAACAASLLACGPGIADLNARPGKYYQQKLSVTGRIARTQAVGSDTLLELADSRHRRVLVRVTGPLAFKSGDWVEVTGVLVPEARVGDKVLYDVLVAEELENGRRPRLRELM
jgi:hypothetical protein